MSTAPPESSSVAPPAAVRMPLMLFIRGLGMLALVSTIVVGAHWYIGLRLIRDSGLNAPLSTALWALIWSAFGSIFAGFIGGRLLGRRLGKVFQWVGFLWMGTFGVLLTLVSASDLVAWVAGRVLTPTAAWPQLQALAVLGLAAPALAWGFFSARRPRVERLTIDIPGLHRAFDGLRIAQLSDVHIGDTLDGDFMRGVVEQVNALQVDIVAVTGDLIDGSVGRLRDEVAPLGGLKGRRGVYYVTGNHEYYSGADAWEAEVARLGLTVLHNEHRVLTEGDAELVVVGVTDLEGARFSDSHRPDLAKALHGAPAVTRLLLAHQPRFAKHTVGHGISLMLSGHTHGGQIFPFMAFVLLQQPVIAGLRTLWGTPVYTSRGTGYWGPPFRIGPTPEITELTLRSA